MIDKEIKENVSKILKQISNIRTGHSSQPCEVIAVIKKQPIEKVECILKLGINNLGFNYVEDLIKLKDIIKSYDLSLHYIGNIQSKKLNKIVGNFDLIHSMGQEDHIVKCNLVARNKNIKQKILLQINSSCELTKGGFVLSKAESVLERIADFESLELCGLMSMPPLGEGENYFKELAKCRKIWSDKYGLALNVLSIGTSGDYLEAISCGSSYIRLGTALLGKRET